MTVACYPLTVKLPTLSEAAPARVRAIAEAVERCPPALPGIKMQYISFEQLVQGKLPSSARGLTPQECSTSDPDSHFAMVAAALCYLAVGGLDEAHNLVTPLSLGVPMPFCAAPIRGSPARQDAAYVHSLVHRREGDHPGMFGIGFNHSDDWAPAPGSHPIMAPLRALAADLARGSPRLMRHMEGHEGGWDARHFIWLCAEAASSSDREIVTFCEHVQLAEWKLLLNHCYEKM